MRVITIAQTGINHDIPGYKLHTQLEDVDVTDADDLGEQAGRLCYLSWDRRNPKTNTNETYLRNILSQQHYSVTEHASVTFYIDGVTRAFLLELERHRHFSYSVVSQRYVSGWEFEFVMHPELMKLSEPLRNRITDHAEAARELYAEIVADLTALGDGEKTARGAARLVLPEGTETRILVTGNLRAWRDMLIKRLSSSADTEIRTVANLILAELKEIAPNTFQDFEDPIPSN
jgi:thymidylate synthase (FAD)